jgi:hypothetical protein
MVTHGLWEITISGIIGGFILSWVDYADDVRKPAGSDRRYAGLGIAKTFTLLLIWPFIGGAVAWATMSSETLLNPLQGLFVGLGGPSIVGYAGPKISGIVSRQGIPLKSE